MTDLGMNHTEMASASASLGDAARAARSATGSSGLGSLAAGVPGTTTEGLTAAMTTDWTTGVQGWSDSVIAFAEDIEGTSTTTRATDTDSGGGMSVLQGLFGL